MSIETRANRVLEQARGIAAKVETWADFSNKIFGPTGIVAKAFPSDMERLVFFDSQQHADINEILLGLMKRFGVAGGANPKEKSGKFVVRVPKTIHHTLDIEAKREGVSLNQLAVTKLSLPLRRATGLISEIVIQSFNDTHDGHSSEWVVIDTKHNELFLERCRELGLIDPPYCDFTLNQALMNIRKSSKYKGRLNPSRKPGFKDYDDCAFAAEIAVRVLQRTDGVSLERALCDLSARNRFDVIAQQMAPTQSVVKLRAAAIYLRKARRLKPVDPNCDEYDLISAGPVSRVSLSTIAKRPGMYAFYDGNRPLFAGESEDLNRRIGLHVHGGLPDWVDVSKDESVTLKFSLVPEDVTQIERVKWLSKFINREKPLLNYQAA